jgi:hypothetical protein
VRRPPARAVLRRLGSTPVVAIGLYAVALLVATVLRRAVLKQEVFTEEESSVSFLTVSFLENRLQYDIVSTNFVSHVFYWLGSHADPRFDLLYGRTWKSLAMAGLPPLVFLVAHLRLGVRRWVAAGAALALSLLPGFAAFSWLATEYGLESVIGLCAVLAATARHRWAIPVAGVLGGLAAGAYAPGLAYVAVVLVAWALWLVRERSLRVVAGIAAGLLSGTAIVLFPLLWWTNGERILTGGGRGPSADVWRDNLSTLAKEVFLRPGDSYYFFSDAPALGHVLLAPALLVAVAVAVRRRAWIPLTILATALALYAVAGPPAGVRRAVPVSVAAALLGAIGVEALAASARPWLRHGAVVVVAAVVALGLYRTVELRGDYAESRVVLPDATFVLERSPALWETLMLKLQSGQATNADIESRREAARSYAVLLLHSARRGIDLHVTRSDMRRAYARDPNCLGWFCGWQPPTPGP